MPKIVLINPPSPFLIDQKVFFPLSLLYISAYLKKHGYDPEIIDLADGKKLPDIDADIIGITSVTPQYPYALNILNELKDRGSTALFVIGGPYATCSPETNKDFDVSVIGEGERSMLRIAKTYPQAFPRFFYSIRVEYIDAFPFPDRDGVDIHSYKYFIDGEPATSIMTARGCPFSCAFCCKTFGKDIRFRSAGNVIRELEELRNKYSYNAVMMYDDEFFINRKRDLEICEYLKKQKFLWRCFTRSNLVDEKIIKIASESGLREILIGIESGSNRILKNINKGTTVEMNRKAIKIIRKHNIKIKMALIVGLPGENEESIRETEQFIQSVEFDDIDFTLLSVYPRTDIYKNPQKYDIKFERGAFYKGMPGHYNECSPISTSSLSFKELVNTRDRLEKTYKRW